MLSAHDRVAASLSDLEIHSIPDSLEREIPDMPVTLSRTAGKVTIRVEEDGAGTPAPDAERLLRRGERADQRHPGEGIGLAVVSEIVRQYRGDLSIGRASLGGAAVSIRLDS